MWSLLLSGKAGSKAVSVSSKSQWPSISVNALQPKTTRSTPGVEQGELTALCHEGKHKGDSGDVEVPLFVAMNNNPNLINPRQVLVVFGWGHWQCTKSESLPFSVCHLLIVCPWANHLTSLIFSLLICKLYLEQCLCVCFFFWLLSDLEAKFV